MPKDFSILDAIHNQLIVSCQALEGEPLYTEQGGVMPLLARAALEGGARAIRANSVRDILQIRQAVALPIIGLIKKRYPPQEPYITATMAEVDQLVEAGAHIIAMDCTDRPRHDGKHIARQIADVKEKYPDQLFMADIATYKEGLAAARAGMDLVSTTLCGYTSYTATETPEPNFDLVRRLVEDCGAPVVAEGVIHYPWQARKMLELGAWSVVVGGAITRPKEITQRFVSTMKGEAPFVAV